jgi:hypothetical protein
MRVDRVRRQARPGFHAEGVLPGGQPVVTIPAATAMRALVAGDAAA